jgi:hypothetical protein
MAQTKTNNSFNPIKEDKDGVIAKRMIWNTATLEMAIKGLDDGRKLVANPFYENNTRLLKAELVFQRTEEEKLEWKKCATDIIYFVNKYCKLMTPQGIKHVTLRGYQERYLQHLMGHRLSIYLACRQCGKCVSFLTVAKIKIDFTQIFCIDDKLKNYLVSNYYSKKEDCFNLPLFELQNLYDKRFIWKLKYHLYKKLYQLEQDEKS